MIITENIFAVRETASSADQQMVQRCIQGDQDAWKQLITRYQRLIFAIASRICRNSDAAGDVLQQVCLELYQRLDEVRNIASLRAWISTVARRKAYEYLRNLAPVEPLLDRDWAEEGDTFWDIDCRYSLERAMAALPERERRLIEMLYMSNVERSYEQVAAELGVPAGSIGPTRIRSLKKLRQLLG
jgi:RNA polymerase sigma factor (sigma-70 family)